MIQREASLTIGDNTYDIFAVTNGNDNEVSISYKRRGLDDVWFYRVVENDSLANCVWSGLDWLTDTITNIVTDTDTRLSRELDCPHTSTIREWVARESSRLYGDQFSWECIDMIVDRNMDAFTLMLSMIMEDVTRESRGQMLTHDRFAVGAEMRNEDPDLTDEEITAYLDALDAKALAAHMAANGAVSRAHEEAPTQGRDEARETDVDLLVSDDGTWDESLVNAISARRENEHLLMACEDAALEEIDVWIHDTDHDLSALTAMCVSYGIEISITGCKTKRRVDSDGYVGYVYGEPATVMATRENTWIRESVDHTDTSVITQYGQVVINHVGGHV